MEKSAVLGMLEFDPERDLAKLLDAFKQRSFPRIPTGLDEHFAVARRKPEEMRNHDTVLAVSIGGSNTKVLLGAMKDGRVVVERVKTRPNPVDETHLYDYFDDLLLSDGKISGYLRNHGRAWMGISLAVGIDDGVPWHPTKIPGIVGLVSRNVERDRDTHHFGRNLEAYFDRRGIPCPSYIYQGDGPIAHLGAVAMTEVADDDRTILLVCGNGLATSDEGNFVLCSLSKLVEEVPGLYTLSEMEGGQYQYLIAGKGLFGVMKRAAQLRASEPGSALAGCDIAAFFATDHDSRRVAAIWETTLPDGRLKPEAQDVLDALGAEAYSELQELAKPIMKRGIAVLGNCILATIAEMGRAESGTGHKVFLEGSVALNPPTLKGMREYVARMSGNKAPFEHFGMEPPLQPEFLPDVRKLDRAPGAAPDEIARVDITMIGALAMALAEDTIRRR